MKDNVFKRRIYNIMSSNQNDIPQRLQKTGLIDTKRLSRVNITERVFKKKNKQKKGKDYFISFLVDTSCSMDGDRYKITSNAIKKIIDLFKDIQGVHTEVYTFSNTDIRVKGYNDNISGEKLREMIRDIQYENKQIINLNKMYDITVYSKDYKTEYKYIRVLDNPVPFLEKYNIEYSGEISSSQKKEFAKELGIIKNKKYVYYICPAPFGGTTYYQSILNAAKRMQNHTGRKIVILLTDGEEGGAYLCGTKTTDTNWIPKQLSEYINKLDLKKISGGWKYDMIYKKTSSFLKSKYDTDVYALGIQTEKGSINHFKHFDIVENLGQLLLTLEKRLRKIFKKD